MTFLYIKSIHIIFVVSWFAGLFYMVRLFIYNTESASKTEPERSILLNQLLLMQHRLWTIITWPAAIITLISGIWLATTASYWSSPWFHVKLAFLIGLYCYHSYCGVIHKEMKNGVFKWSSNKLRVWNEVATLFLFSIVFIVVLKSSFNWIWGVIGLMALGIILMLAIKAYKRFRHDK